MARRAAQRIAGDAGRYLAQGVLPDLIAFANANKVSFCSPGTSRRALPRSPSWSSARTSRAQGMPAKVRYDMSSVLKSIQRIFGVTPLLGHAADTSTNDLGDFFAPGFTSL